jgi:hypothetical protein
MSHSLCVMGMYNEVKVTVPMIVRYVHNDKIREKRNTGVVQTGICYSSRTWQLNEGHNGALSGDTIQKKDKSR